MAALPALLWPLLALGAAAAALLVRRGLRRGPATEEKEEEEEEEKEEEEEPRQQREDARSSAQVREVEGGMKRAAQRDPPPAPFPLDSSLWGVGVHPERPPGQEKLPWGAPSSPPSLPPRLRVQHPGVLPACPAPHGHHPSCKELRKLQIMPTTARRRTWAESLCPAVNKEY